VGVGREKSFLFSGARRVKINTKENYLHSECKINSPKRRAAAAETFQLSFAQAPRYEIGLKLKNFWCGVAVKSERQKLHWLEVYNQVACSLLSALFTVASARQWEGGKRRSLKYYLNYNNEETTTARVRNAGLITKSILLRDIVSASQQASKAPPSSTAFTISGVNLHKNSRAFDSTRSLAHVCVRAAKSA
jgi:hypothetical protein